MYFFYGDKYVRNSRTEPARVKICIGLVQLEAWSPLKASPDPLLSFNISFTVYIEGTKVIENLRKQELQKTKSNAICPSKIITNAQFKIAFK